MEYRPRKPKPTRSSPRKISAASASSRALVRTGVDEIGYCLEQLDAPFTGVCAERNHLLARQPESLRQLGYSCSSGCLAKLVCLGQGDDRGHLHLRKEVEHSVIIFARLTPDVQQ